MRLRNTILAVLAALLLGACGTASTSTNEVGLHYGGGIREEKSFKGIVDPGATNAFVGFGDHVYTYPVDQRTYRFNEDGSAGIVAPTKDGTKVVMQGIITFKLCGGDPDNSDCLTEFHERIGLKKQAWDDDGWNKMLAEFFAPVKNTAGDRSTREFTIDDLRKDGAKIQALNTAMADRFEATLKDTLGGSYFEIDAVNVESIDPASPEVQAQYDQLAAAQLQRQTELEKIAIRQQQADADVALRAKEAESLRILLGMLPPEQVVYYLAIQAALQGKQVPMTFVPAGAQVAAR